MIEKKKRQRRRLPGLLLHKHTGQGRVILNGRAFYLGKYGTPEAHARYAELIEQWEKNHREPLVSVADVSSPRVRTVAQLSLLYDEWIDGTRRYEKDGKPTSQRGLIKVALKEFNRFAGGVLITKLTSALLIAHRDGLSERKDLTIRGVNRKISLIMQFVSWAAERGMIPEMQAVMIAAVKPLKAKSRKRRRPVPLEDLKAAVKHLREPLGDMAQLLYLLACRPGEVCGMRWDDIEREVPEGDAWIYRVRSPKTDDDESSETSYAVHAEAKTILRRHFSLGSGTFVFRTRRRARFDTKTLTRSLRKAARAAGVPEFTAHQVRHLALTTIANDQRGGLAAASAAANHRSRSITDTYIHNDDRVAIEALKILSLDATR